MKYLSWSYNKWHLIAAAFIIAMGLLSSNKSHAFLPLVPVAIGAIAGAEIVEEGSVEKGVEEAKDRISNAWDILTKGEEK